MLTRSELMLVRRNVDIASVQGDVGSCCDCCASEAMCSLGTALTTADSAANRAISLSLSLSLSPSPRTTWGRLRPATWLEDQGFSNLSKTAPVWVLYAVAATTYAEERSNDFQVWPPPFPIESWMFRLLPFQ